MLVVHLQNVVELLSLAPGRQFYPNLLHNQAKLFFEEVSLIKERTAKHSFQLVESNTIQQDSTLMPETCKSNLRNTPRSPIIGQCP